MATETLTIVRIGRVALRVAVCRVTCGALDITFQETGALHQAQRLATDVGNVVRLARRRFKPVARAASNGDQQLVVPVMCRSGAAAMEVEMSW